MIAPEHILLIDDSDEDAEMMEYALLRNGYSVQLSHVDLCTVAVQQLSSTSIPHPDIIILDWKMPKVSGIDCLKLIRNIPGIAAIPLVVLSGAIAPSTAQEAKALGVLCILPKPHGPAEYTIILQQIISLTCNE